MTRVPYLLALLLCLSASGAQAQVEVQITVPLPTIRFEVAPPLTVVAPGISVVPDYDNEVFFVGGWYWVRAGKAWYRTKNYRGGWVVVADRGVPPGLAKIPPGKYKRFKPHGAGQGWGHAKGKGKAW